MLNLKFRAWDYTTEKMGYSEQLGIGLFFSSHYAKANLMQFTGLSDKNGKEIYEGDVVKLWEGEHREGTYPVIFSEGSFGYSTGGHVNPFHEHMAYDEHEEVYYAEIIGNIYETPSLTPIGI